MLLGLKLHKRKGSISVVANKTTTEFLMELVVIYYAHLMHSVSWS